MIESHVVSLDIAKRLSELGVKKPSIFYWEYEKYHEIWVVKQVEPCLDQKDYDERPAAYTASELLEMLKWRPLLIFGLPDDLKEFIEDDVSLCDSLAKILIYLLENGIVKAEDL